MFLVVGQEAVMHTLWNAVQIVFVISLFVGIGAVGVWGVWRGYGNVGRMFGENSKSHWYAKDHDKRQF
jgi:hypothetical protein